MKTFLVSISSCITRHPILIFIISVFLSIILIWFFQSSHEAIQNFVDDFLQLNDQSSGSNKDIYHELLIYLTLIGTLAAIAYNQIRGVRNSMKMDFIRDLDEKWTSKEMTEIRSELFAKYWKGSKNLPRKPSLVKNVHSYLESLYQKSKEGCNVSTLKYIQALNLLDILGTVSIAKKDKILNDGEVKKMFGGQVKQYLHFFAVYENRFKCQKIEDRVYVFGKKGKDDHTTLRKHNAFKLFPVFYTDDKCLMKHLRCED